MNIIKKVISFLFASGVWLIGAIIATAIYFSIFGGLYNTFSPIFGKTSDLLHLDVVLGIGLMLFLIFGILKFIVWDTIIKK